MNLFDVRGSAATFSLATIPLLLAVSATAASTDHATVPPAYLAYYEEDGGSSSTALHQRNAYFNQIATDSFAVNSSGKVSGDAPAADVKFAAGLGMQRYAVVSNFEGSDFNTSIAHAIVTKPKAITTMTAGMFDLMAANGYTGINIDFEAVDPKDRKAFSAFVDTVAKAAHAKGYQVAVSVPAELRDDPTDDWTGAFDFAALGQSADVIQLMTYDENGPWGDPGPVAGLDWVGSSVKYAVSVVPSSKVSLGVPAYGYDWDLTDSTQSTQIPWTSIASTLQATGAVPQWDQATSSPHFTYTASGHKHVVWYENQQSLAAKSALVSDYALAGISVYALGMEDQAFWQALQSPAH
jgi:spore germination protein YaaH